MRLSCMLMSDRRCVREDVRIEEEWFDPRGRQRRASRETNIELRPTNKWRRPRMLITTRGNQRDRADVVTAIRVSVDASVQSRRDADEKCPGKRCQQNGRNKGTRPTL
jgi:hypothetical protein